MSPRCHFPRAGAATLALALTASVAAAEVRDFETPQAAAEAMVEAMGSDGFEAVLSLLDRDFEDELLGGDTVAAKESMRQVHEAAMRFHGLRAEGDDRRIMLIGPKVWPLPFPIVRVEGRWRFDTAEGIEEAVNRRIGRNELNAIAVARAYVAAQREYASVDRDGDAVREFATRITSRPDRRDGLYWEVGGGEPPSPFGPLVADARAYLDGREPGDPYRGYYFKVLSRQGLNPPGGRYDYVINGNMIGGFALVAFPADYGNSGIATFVVSHQGVVLQKDLGEHTELIGGGMEEYNPDETWSEVAD
jgi:hypothetical protein